MAAETAIAELMEWHHADQLPDADMTVLLWVVCGTEQDWCSGWWDGDCWRDCASGGEVAGRVTHWAEVEGPAA
jgi:hypothetical protein